MKKNITRKNKKKIFMDNDYKSGQGMLTSVWGPSLWHFLHTMSFNYPTNPTYEEKINYKKYIYSLQYILPCKYCRINLKKNFKSLPLNMEHMKDRNTFSRYIYDLHELINKMLCKKSNLTYENVRERYEHFRSRCNKKNIKRKTIKLRKTRKRKEKGCIEPLYGEKSKCIIKIVPQNKKCETFQMNNKCKKKRLFN